MTKAWPPEGRSGKGPHFALVPHAMVEDPRVGSGHLALYTALKRWADFGEGSDDLYAGGSHPGSATLASVLHVSRNHVRKLREELVEAGWLSYLEREGLSHLYFLHHEPLTERERRMWSQEAMALGEAFQEGGTEALFDLLEEATDDVENPG